MRITIDPAQEPPHALNRADIKALLAVVPADWLRFVKTVHLGATLPEHCAFSRPVIYSAAGNRLNIYIRGLEPERARREVLRELAARGLSLGRKGNNLSAQELKRVDEVVSTLLKKYRAEAVSEAA